MYQIVCSELSACSLRARPAGVAELRRLCLDGAAALAGETVESWRVSLLDKKYHHWTHPYGAASRSPEFRSMTLMFSQLWSRDVIETCECP